MRKGQAKIVEYVKRHDFSDACIQMLSREDLTIAQLQQLYYTLTNVRHCNDYAWLELYLRLLQKEDVSDYVSKYVSHREVVTYDDLLQMETPDKILKFLSGDGVVCETMQDAEIIIFYGQNKDARSLLTILKIARLFAAECDKHVDLAAELGEFATEFSRRGKYIGTMNKVAELYEEYGEYDELWSSIDYAQLYDSGNYYLINLIANYLYTHTPFRLDECKSIPKEIAETDYHGYKTTVAYRGTARYLSASMKCWDITIAPYNAIVVHDDGTMHTQTISNCKINILYFFSTKQFMTAYSVAAQRKFRPTTLRDLFRAISIGDSEQDRANALQAVEYLCNRYQTNIFKDLYADYLQWNCFLLPLTIEEAAAFHSKKEMFRIHYKMPINGDWNKKNANLSYLILKLYKRLTNAGIAKAMQCKNAPVEDIHIGRNRYMFAWLLYSAVYQENISSLLGDALKEEYEMKRIHLHPSIQTINAHNERQREAGRKAVCPKVKIIKRTKFKKLINAMPEEYELIKTGKRIVQEAAMQHNCVESYAESVSSDRCMIYSVMFQNERHTIEIYINSKGEYAVRQCFRACNRSANPQLAKQLAGVIDAINRTA